MADLDSSALDIEPELDNLDFDLDLSILDHQRPKQIVGISVDPRAEKEDWAEDFSLDSSLRASFSAAGAGGRLTPRLRTGSSSSGGGGVWDGGADGGGDREVLGGLGHALPSHGAAAEHEELRGSLAECFSSGGLDAALDASVQEVTLLLVLLFVLLLALLLALLLVLTLVVLFVLTLTFSLSGRRRSCCRAPLTRCRRWWRGRAPGAPRRLARARRCTGARAALLPLWMKAITRRRWRRRRQSWRRRGSGR